MALTVGDRTIRPLTADEVMRMVDAGIIGEDERVELLARSAHADEPAGPAARGRRPAAHRLARAADGRRDARRPCAAAVRRPGPDLAARARHRRGRARRLDDRAPPHGARSSIEVAVSSLRTDTQVKPAALRRGRRVPEYWVVDVAGQRARGVHGTARRRVRNARDARCRPRTSRRARSTSRRSTSARSSPARSDVHGFVTRPSRRAGSLSPA